MTETTVGGAGFYVCFQDDYLKYRRVRHHRKNWGGGLPTEVSERIKNSWTRHTVVLSNGGKEFNCEAVQKVLEEFGITHRLTMS